MHDDFIEVDGNMYNVRVLRNFCMNAAMNGLSSQTLFGGPAYFIRNIIYNVPNITKHAANPSGMIYYHNTFAAKVSSRDASNYHFRNNLILGWLPGETIFSATTFTNYTSSDYNGFRVDPEAPYAFAWNSPSFDIMQDYNNPRVQRRFKSLGEYSQTIGQDTHSIVIDYDIFMKVKQADPNNHIRLYKAEEFDFRLRPNSAGVDTGCILPNINDEFTGKAPDFGALEVGQPLPVYGPRP